MMHTRELLICPIYGILNSMKVNVISRKLIKPCTPTPQTLKIYKISFTDELSPSMNVAATLLYSQFDFHSDHIINNLEESLSKILPQFYPLAGRYINKARFVDCNDEGAEFIQAQVVVDDDDDVELVELIKKKPEDHHIDNLNLLLPRQSYEANKVTDPLLSIQLTKFNCGGIVMSISVSHKIIDASSIGTFISAWANANRPSGLKILINPSFDTPSFFPCMNFPDDDLDPEPSRSPDPTIVVKRFLFNKDAITSLRAKFRGGRASRVRLVCALIAKALIGVDRTVQGRSRPCLVAQAVNIRERTSIKALSKHCCGNLVAQAVATTSSSKEGEGLLGFEDLVYLIGDAIDKTVAGCREISSSSSSILIDPVIDAFEKIGSGEMNVMWFSDWGKFGFYEEPDFGWGKPVWTGIGTMPAEKLTVLMGNREGDGIDAWVHLNHNYMSHFQQDEDIKLLTI